MGQMRQYTVRVDFTASVETKVNATSSEQAKMKAREDILILAEHGDRELAVNVRGRRDIVVDQEKGRTGR